MSSFYGSTLPGKQAYAILDWAYEEPAQRVQEAFERVNEMARTTTDAALREVQGVCGMLARLGGTVGYDPLATALSNQGIAAQVFDLASRNGHHIPGTPDTYHHGWQPVNNSGAYGASGGTSVSAAQKVRAHQQHKSPSIAAQATAPLTPEQLANHPVIQQVTSQVQQIAERIEREKDAQLAAREAADKADHHRRMMKLATEAGVAIGGGIIAMIEAKLGVPDMLSILTSIVGPAVLQAITEFKKRL